MKKMNKDLKGLLIGFGIFAVIIIVILFFKNPSIKYGGDIVNDGESAIFIADQYLNGNLSMKEFKNQISSYDKYVGSEDGRDIYVLISLLSSADDDAKVLERRNDLAKALWKSKR